MSEKRRPVPEAAKSPEEVEKSIESPGFPSEKMDAEQRRRNREKVGQRSVDDYLTPQEDDSERSREIKGELAGKGLEQSVGVLIGTEDPEEITRTLDVLGISKSTQRTKNGEIDRWRLRNPDPVTKETLPGSFANEEHLKAFLAGFASAESFEDQVRVIHEVYDYLGLEPPALEKVLEDAAVAGAEAEAPAETEADEEAERQAEAEPEKDEKEVEDEDDDDVLPPPSIPNRTSPNQPLSRWKGVFGSLGKHARMISFAVGLSMIGPIIGPKTERYEPPPDSGPAVEMVVAQEDTPETGSEEEGTSYELVKGDTVYDVVKEMLGEHGNDAELLKDTVKQVLNDNGIADESFGTQGVFDSTNLDIGMSIDTSSVTKTLSELNQADNIRGELENM